MIKYYLKMKDQFRRSLKNGIRFQQKSVEKHAKQYVKQHMFCLRLY